MLTQLNRESLTVSLLDTRGAYPRNRWDTGAEQVSRALEVILC